MYIFKCTQYTNNLHILITHIPEYIEKSEYRLGMASDQAVEAMHQELGRRMEKSMYAIKAVYTTVQGKSYCMIEV